MSILKLSLAPVALLAFSSFALAQEAAPATDAAAPAAALVEDLDADRISATEVQVEFDYQGGACEAVEPAQVGENIDGRVTVTFPTSSTAEVCTMQIVEIEVDQVIMSDETVSNLEIVVLGTNGEVQATGDTDIDLDDDDDN